MQIGIVGLPFSGKSTLFQTITKTHIDSAVLAKAELHQAVIIRQAGRVQGAERQ